MAPKRSHQDSANGADSKSPPSDRKILITAGEGHTGRLVIELLLTDSTYSDKFASLTALVFSEDAKDSLEEFVEQGLQVVVFDPKDESALVEAMTFVDTCLLIPPARKVSFYLIAC